MDCPWGNLSIHTFRKLPVNKPSKVKASINKANFILPIWIALEIMIQQGIELRNRCSFGDRPSQSSWIFKGLFS